MVGNLDYLCLCVFEAKIPFLFFHHSKCRLYTKYDVLAVNLSRTLCPSDPAVLTSSRLFICHATPVRYKPFAISRLVSNRFVMNPPSVPERESYISSFDQNMDSTPSKRFFLNHSLLPVSPFNEVKKRESTWLRRHDFRHRGSQESALLEITHAVRNVILEISWCRASILILLRQHVFSSLGLASSSLLRDRLETTWRLFTISVHATSRR